MLSVGKSLKIISLTGGFPLPGSITKGYRKSCAGKFLCSSVSTFCSEPQVHCLIYIICEIPMFECEIFSLLGYAWVTPCFGKPSYNYIAMVTGEHPWCIRVTMSNTRSQSIICTLDICTWLNENNSPTEKKHNNCDILGPFADYSPY